MKIKFLDEIVKEIFNCWYFLTNHKENANYKKDLLDYVKINVKNHREHGET